MAGWVIDVIRRRDSAALESALAPDAAFHSPVRGYAGR